MVFSAARCHATGDIFNMNSFPVINVDKGGNIRSDQSAERGSGHTIPKHEQEGGTYGSPAMAVTDEHDVLEYRDMVTIIRTGPEHDQKGRPWNR
jgi:hypothetical protein